ncbi:MAG: SRPBCC domain-containing protein, partial [Planctomycetes bacterium]|nr:SRPBCC domain-containing protein [Planctomycetota bacterium]
VWAAFATAEGWKLWGLAQCRLDLRVGGRILSHYDPQGVLGDARTIENVILAYDPPATFAYRIGKTPDGFPFPQAWKGTWSVATLTDLGDGRTRLRLAGMGYTADPESQKMRAFFERGNAWSMAKLKAALEAEGAAPAAGPAGAPAAGTAPPAVPDPLAPLVAEAVVNAPPAEVWACWTTSAGMKSFLTDAKIELRVGGPFEVYFDPEAPDGKRGSEGCTVLAYEPSRMLAFSWSAPPSFSHARDHARLTWVVLHLEPAGARGCKVTLRHLGFAEQAALNPGHEPEWREVRAYFGKTWPSVLAALGDKFPPVGK